MTSAAIAGGAVGREQLDPTFLASLNQNPIMLCLGDSYGVDTISQGPVWCNVAANKLQIADMRNYCVGGATFNTDKAKNFDVQADKAIAEVETPEAVKYIGIVGGTNDGSNSITNALINLVNKLHNAFPNATIGIGLNASRQDILSTGAKTKRVAALNLNGTLNIPVYIDSIVYTELGIGCLMADNIHPTSLGSNFIGTHMACLLEGNIGAIVTTNLVVNRSIISDDNLRSLNIVMNGRHIMYTGSVNATPSMIYDIRGAYPDTVTGYYINDSDINIIGYITTGSPGYPSIRTNSTFTGVAYFSFSSYIV